MYFIRAQRTNERYVHVSLSCTCCCHTQLSLFRFYFTHLFRLYGFGRCFLSRSSTTNQNTRQSANKNAKAEYITLNPEDYCCCYSLSFFACVFSTRWKIRALAASPYHNKCETFANVTRLNHILLFYKITWEPYCVCEWMSEWAKTSNRRIFMLLRKV